jgi:hypothetical protein
MIIFDEEYYNMSTLEKNIYTIQDKLTKLKPKSRAFLKYKGRLLKKIEQYKRFIETRTREESLLIKDTLQNGFEIDTTDLKFKPAFK